MSSTAQVAVLAPLGHESGAGREVARTDERPLVRLTGFAALGLFGVLRWGTLMKPAPTWRLLGLLALSVALAGVVPALLERERAVAALAGRSGGGRDSVSAIGAPVAVLAVLVAFPLAGIPLAWVIHLRVAVTADGIGQGLSALPGILVPYSGINEWARTAMVLGAAVLLLDAAMLLAFAPPALGDMRRAGAALPLVALVIVPAISVAPHAAYVQGIVLFGRLVFFMWGERVPADRRGGVILACAATGAIGMIAAPALDQHSPWINTHDLASGFTPAHVDRFNWRQSYGPLVWPHNGSDVLNVGVSGDGVFYGEYWKTENLDSFNGVGWATGGAGSGTELIGVSPQTINEFTQTLDVTISAMSTNQVIAAGYASRPAHLAYPAQPAASLGTWTTSQALGPGDGYTVQVYVPHPSRVQLARAGDDYPVQVRGADLSLAMPQLGAPPGTRPPTVLFPAFGSHAVAPLNQTTTDPTGTIKNSPYWSAYTLARRLARGARTPYAFVERVMNYLTAANGFTYNETPPVTEYPLASFLVDKLGYCQQFAGTMALLLRMGGVPARVATGFTTGTYDTATKRWLVSDIDAHAWVEAWFPHYGWVTFDPTPAAAPARASTTSGLAGFTGAEGLVHPTRRAEEPVGATVGGAHAHAGGSDAPVLFGALGVLLALITLGLVAWRRTGGLDADGLLAELERAMARSGRPISDGITLAALERRFRTSPEAAGYVRALRMARFGSGGELPALHQRRAVRAQLRAGMGLGGTIRALWALPPRPQRTRRKRSAASLN